VFKLKKEEEGRFAYIRWRTLNKILIRTRMLTNRVLYSGWKSCERLSCVEIEEVGLAILLQRKILQGRSRNEGRKEEGRAPGHILNIWI
jgi:hypothetical protein